MRSGNYLQRRSSLIVRAVAPLLACTLCFQASFTSIAAQRTAKKSPAMTDDQRIAHVLARLTFGARPGDFEKVKAMGVDAFINQQLDPDAIDNTGVIAKLRKLPTLNLATPVIIDQYTPPKPAVSPTPAVAKSEVMTAPDMKTAPSS